MKRSTSLKRRQRGLSSVGWLLIATIFGLLIITFFKVFPMYYQHFRVQSSMEALAKDTSIDSKSKRAIWESLQKRLYINEVRSIQRENVTMQRKDGKTTVTVNYEIQDDYIGNLFIGGRFSEQIVIDR